MIHKEEGVPHEICETQGDALFAWKCFSGYLDLIVVFELSVYYHPGDDLSAERDSCGAVECPLMVVIAL